MSILYVMRSTPTDISVWPPTIDEETTTSSQALKLMGYITTHQVTSPVVYVGAMLFSDLASLDSWLDEYSITEPELIEDCNNWKAAHGVTHTAEYYEVSEGADYAAIINAGPGTEYRKVI